MLLENVFIVVLIVFMFVLVVVRMVVFVMFEVLWVWKWIGKLVFFFKVWINRCVEVGFNRFVMFLRFRI